AVTYVSVGVFATTAPIPTQNTSIETLLQSLNPEDFPEGKPYLVELIVSEEDRTLLSNQALFSFLETTANEPFVAAFTAVRLGMLKINGVLTPFIIGTTNDAQNTLKELGIAEPSLVTSFEKVLPIYSNLIAPDSLTTFVSEYRFNIALRTLYTTNLEGLRRLT